MTISSKLTADQEDRNPRESQVKELQILNILKFNGIERINKSVTLRYKCEQVPIEKHLVMSTTISETTYVKPLKGD